jgi:hypothetical protein
VTGGGAESSESGAIGIREESRSESVVEEMVGEEGCDESCWRAMVEVGDIIRRGE